MIQLKSHWNIAPLKIAIIVLDQSIMGSETYTVELLAPQCTIKKDAVISI